MNPLIKKKGVFISENGGLSLKVSNQIIEDVIREVAGDDVLPLVKILKNKKNVSEFTLAEKMNIEINSVRNMLYRLYHANLVSFIRRKDKKKGWYIYYWTFNSKRIKFLILDIYKKRFERLEKNLNKELNFQFFICPNRCIRTEFENATEFEFKCPECGELMSLDNNSEKIKDLQKKIKDLESSIKDITPKPAKKSATKKKAATPKETKTKKTTKKKAVKKKTTKKKAAKKK